MPRIYLSPSTQEWNGYVTGGSEEDHMNLLADALTPYLLSCAIQFRRNTPDMTAASSIRQANEGKYDFYLALHSNASGEGHYGENRGIVAFYYPGSEGGERAAELIVRNLRSVYPLPAMVRVQSTTSLGEVRLPEAPAVLAEIGYHDNAADAAWLETHMDAAAQALARALTEWFGIPFVWPEGIRWGTVDAGGEALNLRALPSSEGTVVTRIPTGGTVEIRGEWQGWYVVRYGVWTGYAASAYILMA